MRRARRLVISSISTIGNYEYGSFWYLHQDGSIHFEMKATGIMNTAALLPGEQPRFGSIVAPGVQAHYHQHVFNMRLDMDVDGTANRGRRGRHRRAARRAGEPARQRLHPARDGAG